MDYEGVLLFGNMVVGNAFLGYIKVKESCNQLKDIEAIKKALKNIDLITDERIGKFMAESTSLPTGLNKQKFISLVCQDIGCQSWTVLGEFLNKSGLKSSELVITTGLTAIPGAGKKSKSAWPLLMGYFVYKITGWDGSEGFLNKILEDVVSYYKSKGIELSNDEADFVPSTPKDSTLMKIHSTKLVGVEVLPRMIAGVEFASRTTTKVAIFADHVNKKAILIIHGRSMFGECDWGSGNIEGLSVEGNQDLISTCLSFYQSRGPAQNYDALNLLATHLL